jgi:hypothetical protein
MTGPVVLILSAKWAMWQPWPVKAGKATRQECGPLEIAAILTSERLSSAFRKSSRVFAILRQESNAKKNIWDNQ